MRASTSATLALRLRLPVADSALAVGDDRSTVGEVPAAVRFQARRQACQLGG